MNHSIKSRRFWSIGLGLTVVYAVGNALAVLMPFIPGVGTLIVWGLALPAMMIAAIWLCLGMRCRQCASWWKLGLCLSVCYLVLGVFTCWLIGQMWAAV